MALFSVSWILPEKENAQLHKGNTWNKTEQVFMNEILKISKLNRINVFGSILLIMDFNEIPI